MEAVENFLSEDLDLENLIRKLDIDEVDVITAAKEQPGLYLKAARFRVQKMREKRLAVSELEGLRADVALKIRDLDVDKKRKRTESNIKELLWKKPEIRKAMTRLGVVEEQEELSKRLLDAYDHRGKAIRVIADLMGAEVAMEKKMRDYKDLVDLKKTVKSKYPGA